MKRYKLLVDSPWGKKGEVIEVQELLYLFSYKINYAGVDKFSPSSFPQIFQLVPEKTDEEVLTDWLIKQWHAEYVYELPEFKRHWIRVAKELIRVGFDVNKIKGEV